MVARGHNLKEKGMNLENQVLYDDEVFINSQLVKEGNIERLLIKSKKQKRMTGAGASIPTHSWPRLTPCREIKEWDACNIMQSIMYI